MNRQLILPVSAAVVGSLLAVGVWALQREARSFVEQEFSYQNVSERVLESVDGQVIRVGSDQGESRIVIRKGDVQIDGERLRDIMEDVRVQIRSSMDEDASLSDAERAEIREALQQLEGLLPFEFDMDADIVINGERLQIRSSASADEESFVFEMDVDGPDLKAVVETSGEATPR